MSKYQNEVLNFHNQTFLLEYAWKTIICLNNMLFWLSVGFLHNSICKESACNAGDPGLIPELGRSPGEGIGYPLQYSWASLVAQTGKNSPAMQETPVPFLSWEDPLEKG